MTEESDGLSRPSDLPVLGVDADSSEAFISSVACEGTKSAVVELVTLAMRKANCDDEEIANVIQVGRREKRRRKGKNGVEAKRGRRKRQEQRRNRLTTRLQ
jgi:hypothetical protein